MSRVHPQHRSDPSAVLVRCLRGTARVPALVLGLAVAVAVATAGGLLALPAEAASPVRPMIQPHKGKRLKTLPAVNAATQAPVPNGQRSPYARAAAQRADSGLPPPGHPYVPQRVVPDAASHPTG